MKRFIIILLAAVCSVTSCDKFKAKTEIEAAKNDAIQSINDARTSAISEAERAISSATAKAVEADISHAITDAKKEIQSEVESSVSDSIDTKLKAFENELGKANKFAAIAAILALGAIILAIVFFIIMRIHTSRDSVIETVKSSTRIKEVIEETVRHYSNTENGLQSKSGLNKTDVEKEIWRYLNSPAFKQYMLNSYPILNQTVSSNAGSQSSDVSNSTEKPAEPSSASSLQTRVELYAKDSRELCLTGVTSAYQQGKSIYRLVLPSFDSQNAEINICLDKDEVKRRILKSSNDLLEPVCKVERRKSNPEDLSSISVKPGKAEKVSGDTWSITEQIIVELS